MSWLYTRNCNRMIYNEVKLLYFLFEGFIQTHIRLAIWLKIEGQKRHFCTNGVHRNTYLGLHSLIMFPPTTNFFFSSVDTHICIYIHINALFFLIFNFFFFFLCVCVCACACIIEREKVTHTHMYIHIDICIIDWLKKWNTKKVTHCNTWKVKESKQPTIDMENKVLHHKQQQII